MAGQRKARGDKVSAIFPIDDERSCSISWEDSWRRNSVDRTGGKSKGCAEARGAAANEEVAIVRTRMMRGDDGKRDRN